MAIWEELTEYSNQKSQSDFERGLGLIKSEFEAMQEGYTKASQAQTEQFTNAFQAYKDWGESNKAMMPEWFNKGTDTVVEAMQTPGIGELLPMGAPMGYLAPNYRTAQQIQQLRKAIAEEMRSRGAIRQGQFETLGTSPDPYEQLLRGSWFHGMRPEAREKIGIGSTEPIVDIERTLQNYLEGMKMKPSLYPQHEIEKYYQYAKSDPLGFIPTNYYMYVSPSRVELEKAFKGFPISLHDSQSISNRLGEPAGVSLSMLPTAAKEFSADDFIYRVLPRFEGNPSERVVNLMTKEGRKELNDAYDVVVNPYISPEGLATKINVYGDKVTSPERSMNYRLLQDLIGEESLSGISTGTFNKALSDQLQSQGKRGLLYNPSRWNEYEMLMLDPKYVLPLDYRKVDEYANIMRRREGIGIKEATPGIRKGLEQLQEVMSQNASRLRDIYKERPWTQRLNEENKRRLLELIEPQYRETVGNQLYQ